MTQRLSLSLPHSLTLEGSHTPHHTSRPTLEAQSPSRSLHIPAACKESYPPMSAGMGLGSG